MMTIPITSKITISAEVLSQEVGSETVLLDLQSESYFGLNMIGTRLWQLLQNEQELQTVLATLLSEFEVEELQLQDDINHLLLELAEQSLISIESP